MKLRSFLIILTLILTVAMASAQTMTVTSLNGTGGYSGDVRALRVTADTAPSADTTISLVSSDPAISVPATVTLLAGRRTANFRANLMGVDSNTSVNVTASASGYSDGVLAMTVVPARDDFSLSLDTNNVRSGQVLHATVRLTGPAGPSGKTLSVVGIDEAIVPSSVTVPYNQVAKTFTVFAPNVDDNANPVVSVTNPSLVNHQISFFTQAARLASASMSRTSIPGGASVALIVALNGNAGADRVISVLNGNPGVLTAASTVTIPAGRSTARLNITSNGVNNDHTVTLYISDATYGGSLTTSVDVRRASLTGVSLNPGSVYGGLSTTGTVTLDGPAGAGGRYISVGGDLNTSMPSTVIVPAGARSVAFRINTFAVDSLDPAKIVAVDGSTTVNGFLFIGPAAPLLLRAPVTSIHPGDTINVNLRLIGVAGPSGVDMAISVTDPSVTVPVSVHVPAGSSTVTFPISMTSSTAASIVIIGATANGRTANLILSTH
jgi:hypothetical protein